ncbi:MAG: PIG-L family deacetylase [Trueperaceae bacterium]|nr:MAG: PIG-L family deacetylase [Trueperaceae bacterium]
MSQVFSRLLWLLALVALFLLGSEFARPLFRPATIQRVLVVAAALLVWAYINGQWIFVRFHDLRAGLRVRSLPEADPFTTSDTVLIIAPHPDDETLAAGGQIQTALAAGAQVFVLFLTCGDGFEWNSMVLERTPLPSASEMLKLGERRIDEALEAAAVLGLPLDNLIFLGYPDGGLMRLFLNHYIHPYLSPYTRVNTVPYDRAHRFGAHYTGKNLERDLSDVITRIAPTIVYAPSPKDAHRDHRAAAYLAMRLQGERHEENAVRYYIVHGAYEYPLPKGYFPTLPLYPPPRGRGLSWRRVSITPAQVRRKAEAICKHRTQVMVMRRFLLAFARPNELWSATAIPIRETIYPVEQGDLAVVALEEDTDLIEEGQLDAGGV